MSSRTIQVIGLRPAQLQALTRKAKRQGKTPPEYVRSLIERDLLAGHTFDELLKPIRADFRAAGITEASLERLVNRARSHRVASRQGTSR